MNSQQFISNTAQALRLQSEDDAKKVIKIVLSTIGKRVKSDERDDANAQMPAELDDAFDKDTNWKEKLTGLFSSNQYDFDTLQGMYHKIADKLQNQDLEYVNAEMATKVVLTQAKSILSQGEIQDIASQLPKQIEELWERV